MPIAQDHAAASDALRTPLTPTFRVELRQRNQETMPAEVIHVQARTIASARHAARRAYPHSVVIAVSKV